MEKTDYELINRIDDFIETALNKNIISTTRFLNPYEQSIAIAKLKNVKGIKYEINGGYKNSERNIMVVYPGNGYIVPDNYLALVKISFSKFDAKYLEHRMILGSVLSLGIKRDGIGDIIIDKQSAYIIATKQMAEYIHKHLLKVGRAHITTDYIEDIATVKLDLKEPRNITGTVSSLRIDCILSLALKISRTKACELIKNQMVFVNWQMVVKPTMQVGENQVITIRKKGRVVLKNIGSNSRKNRIWVELDVYS